MKCPSCRRPADESQSHCPGCGVDLLDALSRRAFDAHVRSAAHRHVRAAAPARRKRRARLKAGMAACAVGAFAFAALGVSRLRPPLSPNARMARGCAFEAPPGLSEKPAVSGVWTELARWEDSASIIEVLYAPPGLAEHAGAPAGAREVAATGFSGVEPRVEASRTVRVDGVDGLHLTVSGGRAYLPSPAAGATRGRSMPAPAFESQDFHGELVLLPASGATLVIRGISGEGSAPSLRRALDAFLSRFRVLSRAA